MRTKYLWLSATAGAACGVAAYFLRKKLAADSSAGSVSGESSDRVSSSASIVSEDAVYSFISGFQDAAAVNFRFSYDSERFRYSVVEDEFLAESGDSHVGVLRGEDFSVQFEYGTYYHGEDFAALRQELSGKHPDLTDAVFDLLIGIRFRNGDHYCLAFPIPEDASSYLLITLVKAPDNDDELETLPDTPVFRALLSSARFDRS